MKIEQLLVQQLYNRKQVSLQGIGILRLADNAVMPADGDKDMSIPPDAITFVYDPKASEDNELIDLIVQQTGKIKPLATADLDSYLMLGKQFLNIGKPLRIEGVGTLLKNQTGQYDFTPGQYISPRIEPANKPLREKLDTDVSFNQPENKTGNLKKWALATLLLVVLGGSGYAVWWYFSNKKTDKPAVQADLLPTTGTPEKTTAPDTTQAPLPPSNVQPPVPAAGDSSGNFRVVFMVTTDKAAALKKMTTQKSRGHKVLMYTTDSVTFKLATPFYLSLADTLRVKDSLGSYYYGRKNVFVETN
jgi:hypothetical protein